MTREYEILGNPWAILSNDSRPYLLVSDRCPHGLKWRQVRPIASELAEDIPALEAIVHLTKHLPCSRHADVPVYLWPNQP